MSRVGVYWAAIVVASLTLVPLCASGVALPLMRGGETTIRIDVFNAGPVEQASATFESIKPADRVLREYTVEVLNPAVCQLGFGTYSPFPSFFASLEISVGPVPAYSSQACMLRIRRSVDSRFDFGYSLQRKSWVPAAITLSDPTLLLGAITDVELSTQQIAPFPPPGGRVGIIRVTVRNDSNWDISPADFGYCQDTGFAPFVLDNDLPDGCQEASRGMICFAVGGPSVAYGLGTLAPHETRSCLLRATAYEPLHGRTGYFLAMTTGASFYSASGEEVIDSIAANNSTYIWLDALGGQAIPSGGWKAMLLLTLLLGGLGAMSLHTRSKWPGSVSVSMPRSRVTA